MRVGDKVLTEGILTAWMGFYLLLCGVVGDWWCGWKGVEGIWVYP